MNIATKTIVRKNQELELTNQRALFWRDRNMLVLSDLHIGKTAHFRKSGIPISSEVLENDLMRLDQLIEHFNPSKLMVVGDLFHAELNQDVLRFRQWARENDKIQIILIKGNHDRQSFEFYEGLNIKVFSETLTISPFTFSHFSRHFPDDVFSITGHTHPGITIKGKGKQRIKLPCFQITEQQLVLPAFSLFTGLNHKNPPEGCIHIAFTDSRIFEV